MKNDDSDPIELDDDPAGPVGDADDDVRQADEDGREDVDEDAVERPPAPPVFRRGDERRAAVENAELCTFCQRHPRKPAGRGGPRPQHCAHVWGQDFRGKDVTCVRLDEAHDLWLVLYGGIGPLATLNVAAQARHLADLHTAADAVVTALDPIRQDLTQLGGHLDVEVTQALERARRADADADQARSAAAAAVQARDEARAARQRSDDAAQAARQAEAEERVKRVTAETDKQQAEEREQLADTRATAATQSLTAANDKVAEQAGTIGELTGANTQLAQLVDKLNRKVQTLEDGLNQQRKDDAAARDTLRREHDNALESLRTKLTTAHEQDTQPLRDKLLELTRQLATAEASAAVHKAAADRNHTAADELIRLRTHLLPVLATATTGDDPTALVRRILPLITTDEPPTAHDDAERESPT